MSTVFWFCLILSAAMATCEKINDSYACLVMPSFTVRKLFTINPRRYDIDHMGRAHYFRGWADVQGQGAANDYCRVVGNVNELLLVCALAGTSGESDRNFSSSRRIDPGIKKTWYMRDQDGDGRDDYCRCTKARDDNTSQVWCTKAGESGFYGSPNEPGNELTFAVSGTSNCENIIVHPQLGIQYL